MLIRIKGLVMLKQIQKSAGLNWIQVCCFLEYNFLSLVTTIPGSYNYPLNSLRSIPGFLFQNKFISN
jgi:hypothetical protein